MCDTNQSNTRILREYIFFYSFFPKIKAIIFLKYFFLKFAIYYEKLNSFFVEFSNIFG